MSSSSTAPNDFAEDVSILLQNVQGRSTRSGVRRWNNRAGEESEKNFRLAAGRQLIIRGLLALVSCGSVITA